MYAGQRELDGHENENRAGSREKLSEGDFQRPLEEKPSNGDRHGQTQARADPNREAFARKFHGAQNERQLGAFPEHHQEYKRAQAEAGRERILSRVGLHALLDLLLQVARHAVHPENHRDDENRRDEQQQPFKSILADTPPFQGNGNGEARGGCRRDAAPDPAHQGRASGAVQINEHDADDQSGFDAFPKSDQK
jgi:hypothetical protein